MKRLLVGIVLAAIAWTSGIVGLSLLAELSEDSRDNATEAYLIGGLAAIAVSVAAIFGLVDLWRRR